MADAEGFVDDDVAGVNRECAVVVSHGIAGIDDQVQDDLFQLCSVTRNVCQIWRDTLYQDSAFVKARHGNRERIRQDLTDIDVGDGRCAVAREGQ